MFTDVHELDAVVWTSEFGLELRPVVTDPSVIKLVLVDPVNIDEPCTDTVLVESPILILEPVTRRSASSVDPVATCSEYGLVIARVPAIGGPAIYKLAAFVAVPEPFSVT
jgi:hypothetical protein